MNKLLCAVLILSFLTVSVFAEDSNEAKAKAKPVKIEWNSRTSVEKGVLVVWTGLIFTMTAITMKEVMMGDYK